MTENPVSEVVNADWEFDVVRTYVLGVEILDQRLSDGEYRLLHLLRLRASGGRNNFVSYESLAKDLGIHAKTIATRMANLKVNGYVTCQKRGLNAPTLKTIASMVERYDDGILKMSRKDMFGKDRSDDVLKRLHHIDNTSQDPIGAKTLPPEITGENDSRRERKRSLVGSENAPSEGVKTLPEVNQEQVNLAERDVTRFARDSTPTAPKNHSGFRKSEREDVELGTTVVTESSDLVRTKSFDAEADARQAKAQELARKAMEDATRLSTVARKKRNDKRRQEDADGTTEEKEKLKKMTARERMTSGSRFYQWAKNEYELFFPEENLKFPEWEPKEFAFLKRLLEIYHQDEKVIRGAWGFMCENWDEVRKKLKIADVTPTIGLFYFLRGRIFPLAAERKTNRQIAEQKPVNNKQGEW